MEQRTIYRGSDIHSIADDKQTDQVNTTVAAIVRIETWAGVTGRRRLPDA